MYKEIIKDTFIYGSVTRVQINIFNANSETFTIEETHDNGNVYYLINSDSTILAMIDEDFKTDNMIININFNYVADAIYTIDIDKFIHRTLEKPTSYIMVDSEIKYPNIATLLLANFHFINEHFNNDGWHSYYLCDLKANDYNVSICIDKELSDRKI